MHHLQTTRYIAIRRSCCCRVVKKCRRKKELRKPIGETEWTIIPASYIPGIYSTGILLSFLYFERKTHRPQEVRTNIFLAVAALFGVDILVCTWKYFSSIFFQISPSDAARWSHQLPRGREKDLGLNPGKGSLWQQNQTLGDEWNRYIWMEKKCNADV